MTNGDSRNFNWLKFLVGLTLILFCSYFMYTEIGNGYEINKLSGSFYDITTSRRSTENIEIKPICLNSKKIVYLKTHKTASTTLAAVIERYGYLRNRTFAVGKTHILAYKKPFNRKDVLNFPRLHKPQKFDMLTNHARFNYKEMKYVVPDATFITIMRNPVSQLESAFRYFDMAKNLNLSKYENPFQEFMKDPMKYFKMQKYMWEMTNNGMLYDLGLVHKYHNDMTIVQRKIEELDGQFSLVLITDYFDQSLVLLMKYMCWNFEDILYLWKGARGKRNEITPETAEKVKTWNKADLKLFQHFNYTFWEKIASYEDEFWKDYDKFIRLQTELREICQSENFELAVNSSTEPMFKNWTKAKCTQMTYRDIPWTNLIRKRMHEWYG